MPQYYPDGPEDFDREITVEFTYEGPNAEVAFMSAMDAAALMMQAAYARIDHMRQRAQQLEQRANQMAQLTQQMQQQIPRQPTVALPQNQVPQNERYVNGRAQQPG